MVEMELVGVRVEMPSSSPIALLREAAGQRRVLPIFIGAAEANAIAFALEEVKVPRPMTHDLFKDVLDDMGVSLEKIVVTDIREGTFFAELELHAHDGVHVVSSRPSDALALAARTGCPIFAREQVLDEAGYVEEEEEPGEQEEEEVVEQFKSFIEQVNPEDFAS